MVIIRYLYKIWKFQLIYVYWTDDLQTKQRSVSCLNAELFHASVIVIAQDLLNKVLFHISGGGIYACRFKTANEILKQHKQCNPSMVWGGFPIPNPTVIYEGLGCDKILVTTNLQPADLWLLQ